MPDLSISIVSFNTRALLRQCLGSIESARATLDLRVTVVDNASVDGSADLVEQEFPGVHLIRNRQNVGFGTAHNQAQRVADGRYRLVLNSDAMPRPGALRTLVDYLDRHPAVAVAGPRLRYPDGRVQPSRRRFPTLATLFLESTQLQRFSADNGVLRRYYLADRAEAATQDVDWLVGACLCVRGDAIAEVGLFDERYFMYSEELDWCRRFRAAGWRVVYVPAAEVVHLEGGSSRLDLAARERLFQTSKLQYAARWHGPWAARALRAYLVVEYTLRAVEESAKLVMGSQVTQRRERLQIIRSGLRHTLRG